MKKTIVILTALSIGSLYFLLPFEQIGIHATR